MRFVLVFCLLGCQRQALETPDASAVDLATEDLPTEDLAVEPIVDLAVADLRRAPDAFCAGTPIAGTCLQPFFEAFADCFQPGGEACYSPSSSPHHPLVCWENGAGFANCDGVWSGPGARCLSSDRVGSGGFCLFPSAPDGGIHYRSDAGIVELFPDDTVCPDGTRLGYALTPSSCPELEALLKPPSANGSCAAGVDCYY